MPILCNIILYSTVIVRNINIRINPYDNSILLCAADMLAETGSNCQTCNAHTVPVAGYQRYVHCVSGCDTVKATP